MLKFKRIVCFISVFLIVVTAVGCQNKTVGNAIKHFSFGEVPDVMKNSTPCLGTQLMTKAAESDAYTLYVNEATLQFAVESKDSRRVWYSSPLDNPNYSGETDDTLRALYILTADTDGTERDYNSYTDGVLNGYFTLKIENNGFTAETAVGQKKEITAMDLPQAVEQKRFETEILSKLSSDDREYIAERYTLFSADNNSISERRLEAQLEKYPTLADTPLYTINNGVPDYVAVKLKNILDSIGYGADEIQKDNDDNGVDIEVEESKIFDLAITVTLTNSGFSVTADCSRLTDSETAVTGISLLPYFAASFGQSDDGFILLPDGSGSVVGINGAKSRYPDYSVKLYGDDKSLPQAGTGAEVAPAVLPAFGMAENEGGFAAVITEGDALVSVNMNPIGAQSVSSVFSEFAVREAGDADAGYTDTASGSLVHMLQPTGYKGKLSVEYMLLEPAGLYEMSTAVRGCLQENGMMPKKKTKTKPALNLEIIGAIDVKSSILGIIPSSEIKAATTFKETEEITERLSENGVENIRMIYDGWANGGLYTKKLSGIKPENTLGGKKGLTALSAKLSDFGGKLLLNAELMQVKNTTGFSESRNAARMLGNTVSKIHTKDIATGNDFDYRAGVWIAPEKLTYYADKFFAALGEITEISVSLSDVGAFLYSDMNTDLSAANTREDTKNTVVDILSGIRGVSVKTGNAYTWASAEYIEGIPLDSSRYKREEYSVPFVQMVLRGYIGYSSSPLNLAGNMRNELLRAVSVGADFTFKVCAAQEDIFYGTHFNDFISVCFDDLYETITEEYKKAYELYREISGCGIIDYKMLSPGVFETVYDNGVSVTVNYNNVDYTMGGITFPATDYVIKGVD